MVATRSSAKRKSPDESPAAQPLPASSSASTPKRRKLPLRKKTGKAPAEIPETDDGEESPAEEDEEGDETLDLDAALQAQVAAENPTPVIGAAEARWQAAGEEEDEDSDDEAPEAVSNVQAASRARDAAESMKKAAREYVCPGLQLAFFQGRWLTGYREAEKLRQKRKDRDARLKEQALTRKVKEPSPVSVPQNAEPEDTPTEIEPIEKPSRTSNAVTTLLPDEFLDSDSEPEVDDAPTPKRRKSSKQKAAPRDKRVGGTVYRVMKGADSRMAPKGEGRSRQVRANLAKRGREGAGRKGGVCCWE